MTVNYKKNSRVRLTARTPPSHGGNTGSIPVRGTQGERDAEEASFSFLFNRKTYEELREIERTALDEHWKRIIER